VILGTTSLLAPATFIVSLATLKDNPALPIGYGIRSSAL
jgi:hypothetical protein